MERERFHPAEAVMILLEGVIAVGAFAAGLGFVLDPTGSGVIPIDVLAPSPFSTFLVPGLALIVLNGVLPVAVVVGTLRRKLWARLGHVVAGVVLMTWIVVQLAMVGAVSALQPVCFAIGAVLVALGTWRMLRGRDPLGATVPPSERLDAWAPDRSFADTIALWAKASPRAAMRAFREVTPRDMPIAMWAGELRYLPARLTGRMQKAPRDEPFFDQLVRGGTVVLDDVPGEEVIVGSAGKLHQLRDQEPVAMKTPEDFVRFDAPEHQKLVMSVRVVREDSQRGTLLALEHRTMPLDARARDGFARYWTVIRPAGAFVTRQLLRAARRRAERERERPRGARLGAPAR